MGSTASLIANISNIFVSYGYFQDNDLTFIIPKNILCRFAYIADAKVNVAGMLFGVASGKSGRIFEVRIMVVPRQKGNEKVVEFSYKVKTNDFIRNMSFLGVIETRKSSRIFLGGSFIDCFVERNNSERGNR